MTYPEDCDSMDPDIGRAHELLGCGMLLALLFTLVLGITALVRGAL